MQNGIDIPPEVARDATRLDQVAGEIETAVRTGDWATARERWRAFDDLWFEVEDGFRSAFPSSYRDIERAMGAVADTLRPAEPASAAVLTELASLRGLLGPFLTAPAEAGTPAGRSSQGTPTSSGTTPVPTLRLPTATPSATTIPTTCQTPSLTLSGSSVSSDGVLEWQARGFKPGTAVEIEVLGPTSGVAGGPELFEIEEQVVGSRCEVIVEPAEFIKGGEFRHLNAPTGTYVLQVEGIRYYPPNMTLGVQEQQIRLLAPFSYYTVKH